MSFLCYSRRSDDPFNKDPVSISLFFRLSLLCSGSYVFLAGGLLATLLSTLALLFLIVFVMFALGIPTVAFSLCKLMAGLGLV